MGGPWRTRKKDDWPHGLDIVQALTGPDGWGTDRTPGDTRVVWATARMVLTYGDVTNDGHLGNDGTDGSDHDAPLLGEDLGRA